MKLLLAAFLPLAPDEAYYWFWSHHLQWSYFDHPPFVAFLFWLGHPLENWIYTVRWPALILSHLSLLFWWSLLKNHLDGARLQSWTWLFLLTPLLGFGSLVITPDIPVLFFWAAALFFFERALTKRRSSDYILFGLSLGLGFSSKYHIVLLPLSLLIYLTLEKSWSKIDLKKTPLVFIFGVLGSLPVLYWNATHEWRSFLFQLNHGFGRSDSTIEWTLSYVLGQIFLFGPLLIPSFLRGLRRKDFRLFSISALSVWIFFLYSSTKGVVEANWPLVIYPSALAVAAIGQKKRWVVLATCASSALLAVALGWFWIKPWTTGVPENVLEPYQFRTLKALAHKYSPLYASSYQMASILSFESKTMVFKLRDMSRYDFYDELPESLPKEAVFYLLRRKHQNLPDWLSEKKIPFEIMETIEPNFEVLRFSP